MPASRSEAATTLAPRSWPSRPGLQTRTRILRSAMESLSQEGVDDGRTRRSAPTSEFGGFFVGAEDGLHRVDDLAERRVRLDGGHEARHEVVVRVLARLADGLE